MGEVVLVDFAGFVVLAGLDLIDVMLVTLVATVEDGAGLNNCVIVESCSGSGALTINSEGLWQLSVFAVLSQHLHSSLVRS